MSGWTIRAYMVLFLAVLYAPILLLPVFAFNYGSIIAFPLQGFSTRWFQALWDNQALHTAVSNSLFIAVVAALLATLLGTCAARAGTMERFPGKGGMPCQVEAVVLPQLRPPLEHALALVPEFGVVPELAREVLAHCGPHADLQYLPA